VTVTGAAIVDATSAATETADANSNDACGARKVMVGLDELSRR
jgi:hypothetical protein